MALVVPDEVVEAVLTPDTARRAILAMLECERAGQAGMPERLNTPLTRGWFRVMPGRLTGFGGQSGEVFGFKAMHLIPGAGLHYLIAVFEGDTGELMGLLDGAAVTRLRTGATSAVALELLKGGRGRQLAILGSGFEARGQLLAVAPLLPDAAITVYSPQAAHREAFAAEMAERLDRPVMPVADPRVCLAEADVVVAATKTTEPVLQADWLAPDALVLSIGATRPDLRELDAATLARAGGCWVDHPGQALKECGDIQAAVAAGGMAPTALRPLWQALEAPPAETGLTVFKSVGTALQDLACAAAVLAECGRQGLGRQLGTFPRAKPARGN